MRIPHAPTIFESFNARALKPSQVAETFVPSKHYDQLVNRNNTIVVGPRGSGKTTLLKMLQQQALEAWEHGEADMFRSRIDYTGVFIATDLSWGAQIQALGEGKLDPDSHKLLSIAAFTTHVLRSVILAMLQRIATTPVKYPFRRVILTNTDEVHLVKILADAWHIQPLIPSLLSLKQSLSVRLLQIREIAGSEVTRGEAGRANRLSEITFLHSHFVEAAAIATESFNDLIGESGARWTLMFDELELAPEWIQDELIRSLRTTDSVFLYKLAMSPYSYSARLLELKSGKAPAVGQDFEQIALWYAEKQQTYEFCYNLWKAMLRERGVPPRDPPKILGRSYFENYEEDSRRGGGYGPESRAAERFATLAHNDVTFQHYLMEKGINPNKLDEVPKPIMDSVVRKISSLVAVREYYRAPDRERTRQIKRRTRKAAIIYAGAESLFAVSEGNPRWFIAIVGRLLEDWRDEGRKIPAEDQAREMKKAAQRFSAMLRTIPAPPSKVLGTNRGVLSLIQAIAHYFHDQVVMNSFIAEPSLTFTVDPNTTDDMLYMLEQALNAGAVVYIPEEESELILSSSVWSAPSTWRTGLS
jgi:energy-coupling factor transporter ATP-binding protein EcfA2